MFTMQPNVFASGAGGSLSHAFSAAGSLAAEAKSQSAQPAQNSSGGSALVAQQVQAVALNLSTQGVQLSRAVREPVNAALGSGSTNDFPPNLVKKAYEEFPPNYLKQGANLASSMMKRQSDEFPPNYLRQTPKTGSSSLQSKPLEDFPPNYLKKAAAEFPPKLTGKKEQVDFPPNYLKQSDPFGYGKMEQLGTEQAAGKAYGAGGVQTA